MRGSISTACGRSRSRRATAPTARLLRETARHLALRMSYEDVIRVAEAKIAPERIAGIVAKMGGKPGEPVAIVEFLKPGIEEFCQLLPPRLATAILRVAERRGWIGRFHWGMEVRTTSVTGYLRFWLLAKLRAVAAAQPTAIARSRRRSKPGSALIAAAARESTALALEIAECARLIKGYGDTLKRGAANYAAIEARVIGPALAGRMPVGARHRRGRERAHGRARSIPRARPGTLPRRNRAQLRPRHRRRVNSTRQAPPVTAVTLDSGAPLCPFPREPPPLPAGAHAARPPTHPEDRPMRIDAYTHFIPKKFFEAVEKVPGAGTDIGKRMRGVPCVYDLDERRRIVGLFPDYAQILSYPMPPLENFARRPTRSTSSAR